MVLSTAPAAADASLRSVLRFIAEHVPDARPLAEGTPPLDFTVASREKPRTTVARILEGTTFRPRRILDPPLVGLAAFLDGVQRTQTVAYAGGVPIVYGQVAAAIRVRRNRRLTTWRRKIEARLYLPFAYLDPRSWEGAALPLVDTSVAADGSAVSEHPIDLQEHAIHRVQTDRERLEFGLADEWCAMEQAPLLIDGGISGSDRVATAPCSIGVVKSHRTLYAEGDALRVVFALRAGERSSVVRISSKRTPVASWYLRLRDPAGHDPMWGLVRVEVAEEETMRERQNAITARADLVSRWLLADVTPLALPDARWDKMVYGVRDCEEFLRAIS